MTSYFLDTNIFLRTIVGDHAQQTKECDEFFTLLRTGTFLARTSSVVLAEVVSTAISFYDIKKEGIVGSVRGIMSTPRFAVDDSVNMERALELYERHAIKFVDALIAGHPAVRTSDFTLVSYDRDFDKLGITRVGPREVVRLHGKGQKDHR